jgi:hypothetical protein
MASWASKIMNNVCSALIVPSSKIGMPKDFYFRIEDRTMPSPAEDTWQQQRDRLFVNTVRRKIVAKLAVIGAAINVPVLLLLLLVYIIL